MSEIGVHDLPPFPSHVLSDDEEPPSPTNVEIRNRAIDSSVLPPVTVSTSPTLYNTEMSSDPSRFAFRRFKPKKEDPVTYISEFEAECDIRRFDTSVKYVVLKRCLRNINGKYSTWYEDEGTEATNYAELVHLFTTAFELSGKGYVKKCERKLYNTCQKKKDTVREYAITFAR